MLKLLEITNDDSLKDAYAKSSYVTIHPHMNGYAIYADSPTCEEKYPFGYRLKDSDDWNNICNAWIAPNGTVYYVFSWGHCPFAFSRHGKDVSALEKDGWIHWSGCEVANYPTPRYTKAQRESLCYLFMGVGDNEGAMKILED